jgi:hypothetical protein
MQIYNKVMLFFWLLAAIFSLLFVSYMCFTVSIERWAMYFIVPAIAFGMFFFKRWMINRMDAHVAYMNAKKEEESKEK